MSFPIVIPASSSAVGSGPTRRTLYRRLADELGFYQAATVSEVAANADAARVTLAEELEDHESGWEQLGAPWVYAASGVQAGVQRRMVSDPEAGYQGNIGAVTLSRPFAAALAEGTLIELTNPLPVTRINAVKGLVQCINEALARIWVEARLAITGNGTVEYNLASTYGWINRDVQLVGIYDTINVGSSTVAVLARDRPVLSNNGSTHTLQTGITYTTASTFYLSVLVRADRLIYDGTSWNYKTDTNLGLLSDTDQCAAPIEWVMAFAMVKALQFLLRYTRLRRDLVQEEKAALLADIMDRKSVWVRTAARIKLREMPRPPQESNAPLFGPADSPGWD